MPNFDLQQAVGTDLCRNSVTAYIILIQLIKKIQMPEGKAAKVYLLAILFLS